MSTKLPGWLTIFFVSAILTTSCTLIDNEDVAQFAAWSENNGPDLTTKIRVTGIEITGEMESSLLDVEVHLYDADTGEFLGCSGGLHGLNSVDASDQFYRVNAFFTMMDYTILTYEMIEERSVYLLVIEDDRFACPGAYVSGTDDVVGRSNDFCGCDLAEQQDLSFGNVTRLIIGM